MVSQRKQSACGPSSNSNWPAIPSIVAAQSQSPQDVSHRHRVPDVATARRRHAALSELVGDLGIWLFPADLRQDFRKTDVASRHTRRSANPATPFCVRAYRRPYSSHLPLARLRRRRFFRAKGKIKPLQHTLHLDRRPFAATRRWNARSVQALSNGPQTRFSGRL